MHFSGLKMRRIQVWQYRLTASLGETPYYSVIDIDYTFGHKKGLLSRIYGLVPALEAGRVCDRGLFP